MSLTSAPPLDAKRRTAILRVMCLALMMVVAAVASLNVALPDISRDTGASQSQLQWIVDAYALAFAALLLPAGAIGDRFGRRPMLLFGLSLYGLSSAGAMLLNDPQQLIGMRVLMGIAAAFVMPVTLSVITSVFPPQERGKAVGTWVGVAAGGGVLGLIASGLLLQWLSWPAIFGLNVVMAIAALAGTIAVVPATRELHPPRLDPIGALISVASLVALVYGINEAPDNGWTSTFTLATLGAGIGGLAVFTAWELRRDEPMLDPRNFLRRGFGAGSLSITVQFFAAFGFLFLLLPYLQLAKGFSPLESSAALLPMAMMVIPLSRKAPMVAARLGVRVTGAAGLSLMAGGFAVLSTLSTGSSYWHVLAGLIPFGAGMALSGAPATTAIVASLPREKQGIASAVNDVSRELGGALGIAVLGSIFNSGFQSDLANHTQGMSPAAADSATTSLAAAQQVAQHMGVRGQQLMVDAQAAFIHGLGLAFVAGCALLLAGAAFVAVRAPGREESRANAGDAAPASGLAAAR